MKNIIFDLLIILADGWVIDKDDLWLAIEYTKRVVGYNEFKEDL